MAWLKVLKLRVLFLRIFSQALALFGIAAIPPKAIKTSLILFLSISKLKDPQTDEISSSNLFDILNALNIFFLNNGIFIDRINSVLFNLVFL